VEVNDALDVTSLAMGVIEAMKHLAKHSVVHRDIKPENIMLKNGVPKLIDFGFARIIAGTNEVLV